MAVWGAQVVAAPLQSALYPFLTMLLLQPAKIACCFPQEAGQARPLSFILF